MNYRSINLGGNLTSRIYHHEGHEEHEARNIILESDGFAIRISVLRVLRELRGKEKGCGRAIKNFMIPAYALRTKG